MFGGYRGASGGRQIYDEPGRGGVANTNSIHPGGLLARSLAGPSKQYSAEDMKNPELFRTFSQAVFTKTADNALRADHNGATITRIGMPYDQLQGVYCVLSQSMFAKQHEQTFPSETYAFVQLGKDVAALEESGHIQLKLMEAEQKSELAQIPESDAQRGVKVAVLEAKHRLKRMTIELETANKIKAMRISGCRSLEEKQMRDYQNLSNAGAAAIYTLVTPELQVEMQRHIMERRMEVKAEASAQASAQASAPDSLHDFPDMWDYLLELRPAKDMHLFAKLVEANYFGPDKLSAPAYLALTDKMAVNLKLAKQTPDATWELHILMKGVDPRDRVNHFYEIFMSMPYMQITQADVERAKNFIRNADCVHHLGGPGRALLQRPAELARRVEFKMQTKDSGKTEYKKPAPKKLEARACFNCGELGHFKADCPNPPKMTVPMTVPHRLASNQEQAKTGPSGSKTARIGNGSSKHAGSFNIIATEGDDSLNDEPPELLPELVDLGVEQIAPQLNYEMPLNYLVLEELEKGNTEKMRETVLAAHPCINEEITIYSPREDFDVYKLHYLKEASRVTFDSGTTKNICCYNLLHDREPVNGKVQYGNGSVEKVEIAGVLKIEIEYGDPSCPSSFPLEIICWGSCEVKAPLFSNRLFAKSGAIIVYGQNDDGPEDYVNLAAFGGPTIKLDSESSIRVRLVLPSDFDYNLKQDWLATKALSRKTALGFTTGLAKPDVAVATTALAAATAATDSSTTTTTTTDSFSTTTTADTTATATAIGNSAALQACPGK